ncbi:hypothetical protein HanPI659440_Chr15g0608351 [Helianthus annuus]|nr:hypothetical protein HanPI659440_Chr15g0608351 [Helianthus annuus]
MGVLKEQVESTLRSKLSPSHISSKLWTKKHGFGRKDVPRSRSTQTVNLKMRQRLFDFEELRICYELRRRFWEKGRSGLRTRQCWRAG